MDAKKKETLVDIYQNIQTQLERLVGLSDETTDSVADSEKKYNASRKSGLTYNQTSKGKERFIEGGTLITAIQEFEAGQDSLRELLDIPKGIS